MSLTFNTQYHNKFEITLVTRDINGNPTNKKKSFSSNDSYKVWEFYQRNSIRPKPQHKKTSHQKLPTPQQAEKLLAEVAKYAEDKQKRRLNHNR